MRTPVFSITPTLPCRSPTARSALPTFRPAVTHLGRGTRDWVHRLCRSRLPRRNRNPTRTSRSKPLQARTSKTKGQGARGEGQLPLAPPPSPLLRFHPPCSISTQNLSQQLPSS